MFVLSELMKIALLKGAEEFDFLSAWLPDAPGRGGGLVRNPDRDMTLHMTLSHDRDMNSCSPAFPLSCNGADKTRSRTLAEVWPWHKHGA